MASGGAPQTDQHRLLLAQLTDLPITIDATVDDLFVFRLARGRNLTFYDATYLALALRCRVPLATLDGALIAAANVEHVRLVGRR